MPAAPDPPFWSVEKPGKEGGTRKDVREAMPENEIKGEGEAVTGGRKDESPKG